MVYLLLILLSFITCWRTRALARRKFHTSWIINYATMFEASLVCFMVGAVFLNRAHFDLFYHWVAIILLFGRIAQAEVLAPVAETNLDDGQTAPLAALRRHGFEAKPVRRGFRDATPAAGA